MADRMFPKAKQSFLAAEFGSLLTQNLKVALLLNTYVYNAAHQYVSDLAASIAAAGRSGNLTTKSITDGVFDADNVTFTAVTGSQTIGSWVLYVDSGSDATSRLIAFVDSTAGLPLNTNGGDVTLAFDNGANKIFALTDV